MAFEVQFGTTNKRYNSTAQANKERTDFFSEIFTTNVLLKENCSILNPVFIIDMNVNRKAKSAVTVENINNINYCRCISFARYYWVTDITWATDRIVYISCSVDALASHWTQYKEYIPYLKYTSNKLFSNTELDDDRLGPDLPVNVSSTSFLSSSLFTKDSVTVILTVKVLQKDCGEIVKWAISPINYYKMYWRHIANVGNVFDILERMWNDLGGLDAYADYILDSYLVPVAYTTFSNKFTESQIKIANIDCEDEDGDPIKGVKFSANDGCYETFCSKKNVSISSPGTSPALPTTNGQNNDGNAYFLRGAKYLKFALKHPCGCEEFCSDALAIVSGGANSFSGSFAIGYKIMVNYLDAEYIIEIWDTDFNILLCSGSGNVRIPIAKPNGEGKMAIIENAGKKITDSIMALGNTMLSYQVIPGTSSSQTQFTQTSPDTEYHKTKINRGSRGITSSDTYRESTSGDYTVNRTSTSKPPQRMYLDMGVFGSLQSGLKQISPTGSASFMTGQTGLLMSILKFKNGSGSGELDDKYMFQLLATLCVPSVCESSDIYKAYAKRHGYPSGKMLTDKTIEDIFLTDPNQKGGTYVQCSYASVPMSMDANKSKGMMPEEVAMINSMLNSGIFVEGV